MRRKPYADKRRALIEEPDPNCTEDAVPVSEAEIAELPNPLVWHAHRNEVVANLAQGNDANGGWDIMNVEPEDKENCFADNDAAVFSPADLETVAPCGGPFGVVNAESAALIGLLDANQAEPARGPTEEIDVDAIQVPPAPTD